MENIGDPGQGKLCPCSLGEHNDSVFKEILKMPEDEIKELTEQKITGGDRYVWA